MQKRRPIPNGLLPHLKEQEAKWQAQGVIEDVPISEAIYACNLCFSAKKDQNSSKVVGIRTCIDLREINAIIEDNSFT